MIRPDELRFARVKCEVHRSLHGISLSSIPYVGITSLCRTFLARHVLHIELGNFSIKVNFYVVTTVRR